MWLSYAQRDHPKKSPSHKSQCAHCGKEIYSLLDPYRWVHRDVFGDYARGCLVSQSSYHDPQNRVQVAL